MAARVVVTVVAFLLVLSAGTASGQVNYSGTWNVSDLPGIAPGTTPWSDGGTLTIRSSSESAAEQFDNNGPVARPQCLGYPESENVAEDDQPRVSAWYAATYSWSGGGEMAGCVSNKTSGKAVFFGSSSDVDGSLERTRSGTYVGCWQGPRTPGSYCFNASKTAESPPSGGGNTAGCGVDVRPPTCAILFGATTVLPVPAPETAGDISSARLPARTTEVGAEVTMSDAEIDQVLATLALIKFIQDAQGVCILYTIGPPTGNLTDAELTGASFSATICARLAATLIKRARTNARASQSRRCRATFVPVVRRGGRLTARKRRAVVAAYRNVVNASCSSSGRGQMSIKLVAKRRRTPLNRLLGRRARASFARSAPEGAADGPNAKMTVRWRRR